MVSTAFYTGRAVNIVCQGMQALVALLCGFAVNVLCQWMQSPSFIEGGLSIGARE